MLQSAVSQPDLTSDPQSTEQADVQPKRNWTKVGPALLMLGGIAVTVFAAVWFFAPSDDDGGAAAQTDVAEEQAERPSFQVVAALPSNDGPTVKIFPPGVDPNAEQSRPLVAENGVIREVSLQTSSVRVLSPPRQNINMASQGDTSVIQLRSAVDLDKGDPSQVQLSEEPPAAGVAVIAAAATPRPTTPPTPTATPIPVATATEPGPPLTPYIEVIGSAGAGTLVDLRTGPGFDYPAVAKLGPGIPIAIDGRNPEGTWFRICCINGGSFWVEANGPITVGNPVREVALFVPDLPPTPTPTPTFTATPPPFDRAIGPEFFPTNNGFLTIWAKVFVGGPESEDPLAGYMLAVEFEDGESGAVETRRNASGMESSADAFLVSAAEGAGNRVFFNYKYEYHPGQPPEDLTLADMLGTGTWRIWLTNAEGAKLSEPVTFTSETGNPNREIYVGWARVR